MWCFGCSHKRTTLPMTLSQRTYVTCLTCGEELAYNWDKMRLEGLFGARQSAAGRVKQTVDPPPADSTQMRPPRDSTAFWQ